MYDNKTGKVFIGTDKGLCSYQSEASETNEDMNKDNVWAYPNPVRPEYRGMITITGLSFNADVKITTSNGVLVAQGRSTGGSFLWDGNDLKRKPNSLSAEYDQNRPRGERRNQRRRRGPV